MKPHAATCAHCGKPYTQYIKNERFCSRACQKQHGYEQRLRLAFERIYKKHGIKVKS